MGMRSDSARILRLDMQSGTLDSVARVKTPDTTERSSGDANNQSTEIGPVPLSPADAWGAAPDGRVVIVRSGDYRVEWVAEDGSVASGPPIPYSPVPIGQAEREESGRTDGWRRGAVSGSPCPSATARPPWSPAVERPRTTTTISTNTRGRRSSRPSTATPSRWTASGGRGCAATARPAKLPPTMSSAGAANAGMTVELPLNRRIVGFGDGVAYAVRMDAYGLQTLERYGLP